MLLFSRMYASFIEEGLSWGVEVATYDLGASPLAVLPIIDISAYDKVQIFGYGLTMGTGGINFRYTKSGTPITTSGYYTHVRQRASAQDTITFDAVGDICPESATSSQGSFNFEVEHHNSNLIPTLATSMSTWVNNNAENGEVISNVVEIVDGLEILTADAANITSGTIHVIGYKYPTYTETLLSSEDYSVNPNNDVIVDNLDAYDEVRFIGRNITCTQPIRIRLRNGGTDISTTDYYSRIAVANSDYNLSANAGYALTLSTTGAGHFSHRCRWAKYTNRPTVIMGKLNRGATVGAHELLMSHTLESHSGIRFYSESGTNITNGTIHVVGINRGETVTLIQAQDMGSTPNPDFVTDDLGLYQQIEWNANQMVLSDQAIIRFRKSATDISTTDYYKRWYIGGTSGEDDLTAGFMFGSGAGGSNRNNIGHLNGHLSSTRPTMVSTIRGDSSTVGQIIDLKANSFEKHTGLHLTTDDASNFTGGNLNVFGITYEPFNIYPTFTATMAAQSSTMTDFPLYIDLANMPDEFWASVDKWGENIRVYQSDGTTLIPHHVRVYKTLTKGAIWCKHTLSSTGTTEVVIKLTDDVSPLATNDANGRDNVFNAFELFTLLGEDNINYGSEGGTLRTTGDPQLFEKIAVSNDTNSHQGVAVNQDTGEIYTFDTNAIRKWSGDFGSLTEADTNADPNGDVETYLSASPGDYGHLNDGFYDPDTGYLYTFAGEDEAPPTKLALAWFDPSQAGIPLIGAVSVIAEDYESPGACCIKDGEIVSIEYNPSGVNILTRINKTTGAKIADITLTGNGLVRAQGIVWWRGAYWVSCDETSGGHETFRVEETGEISAGGVFSDATSGNWEGIAAFDDDTLICMHDQGTKEELQKWQPYCISKGGGGGVKLPSAGTHYLIHNFDGVGSMGTTWTIGITFSPADNTQRAFAAMVETGTNWTNNAHFVVDNGNSVGTWDSTNGWLYFSPTVNPDLDTFHGFTGIYEGTSKRSMFYNGADKVVDNSITARGAVVSHFALGNSREGSFVDPWVGKLGVTYARSNVWSDDEIGAFGAMLDNNAGFVNIINQEFPVDPDFSLVSVLLQAVSVSDSEVDGDFTNVDLLIQAEDP